MNPGPGNRQDNRQRGNAAQLLEKYKGLARDAQMQGDRVQSEYYLQFADHYYRVLNESRARFEEQRRQRGDSDEGDEDEDGDEMDMAPRHRSDRYASDASEEGDEPREQRETRAEREPREQREPREPREQRESREPREPRSDANGRREPRRAVPNGEERVRRPRTRRTEEGAEGAADGGERIAADSLPPAISVGTEDGGEAPRTPRRRTRKPREGDEIAPAA